MDGANEFLDRVFDHVGELDRDRFNYKSWRFGGRPTSEGVGIMPGLEVDPEAVVARVLDVEAYPDNVDYVKKIIVTDRRSASDVTYVQKMELPFDEDYNVDDYEEED